MIYKIEKSLGRYTAVQVESITNEGYCFDVKNFGNHNITFAIYTDGTLKDININGWTFPFAYNRLTDQQGNDVYGGHYRFLASFEVLDKNGRTVEIKNKTIYGYREVDAVIYFFTMLYNISLCVDIQEFSDLYRFIIDNDDFKYSHDYAKAAEILNFIKDFKMKFKGDDNDDLKLLIKPVKEKFAKAKEIIIDTELNF